ncbi:DUF1289 domain-containing protein [Rheinheimera baltica]|uniref:DUF1289 domain-containing protein n=1 Tax=Rheinheimera baltica TaxID=67576 RepID=A0ABT9I1H7_9GAMM|nr:DUF1289 domain-containing protein [Rheinheimera baltica]MDP5136890.1 DUF1289 domain-containing protein [Rheinheimera baltica]MDP5144605.1 DUF1289 domain-containing protein [Rheinheimera baltica]
MVDSPCVRNCCLDQQDCCLGCGRKIDEIMEWHQATDLRRQQILVFAAARMAETHQQVAFRRLGVNPSE